MEKVLLSDGRVIEVQRTAKIRPFGEVGGPGGWENEGMTLKIVDPIREDDPPEWSAKFVPLVFDRDPQSKEWFVVATFYSCESWYSLGRPKLPYTEFRLRQGKWTQQALSTEHIGRKGNMLTRIRSSGEPNHTLESKARIDEESLSTAPEYKRVVERWKTTC